MRILVTGANGQLGRLVLDELSRAKGVQVLAGVRQLETASHLAEQGVELVKFDYNDSQSLTRVLDGVDRLLLISSSEVGRRTQQHRNVIDAARAANVQLIAYTSILRANENAMILAGEHQQTESILRQSGVPHVLLRNGWYTENYLAAISQALMLGRVFGCAGDGLLSLAARRDYAAAAAAVITAENQAGKVYELAGDLSYTMRDIAAEIGRQSGKPIEFVNLPPKDYRAALEAAGFPEGFAIALADSDTQAADGALYDNSQQLSKLIGRATTTLSASVKLAFEQLQTV